MSQEPAAEDIQQETKKAQPPPEEVRETDKDGEVEPKEEIFDAEDVEELEPSASDRPEALRPLDVGGEPERAPPSMKETIDVLRMVREDVGQICELSSEERKLVEAFSLALLKLMQPLAKTIPVEPSALPEEMGDIESANIVPRGELIVQYPDGRMESIDLSDDANRDLLIDVVRDVIPKFKVLFSGLRAKIETRMGFLASVTRELQNIAEAFSSI